MAELSDRLQAALGAAYRIEKELGGGGMSRVFVAEETRLARHVVIKVLPPELAAAISIDRFNREIQLSASLQHPQGFALGVFPVEVLRALERGRVNERLGNRERAIAGYTLVVQAWLNPDPELKPYVDEARAALVRLGSEPRKSGS